jgi:hypothetical protein
LDPNEVLNRMREIEVIVSNNQHSDEDVRELVGLFGDLDRWLCKCGFLPHAWALANKPPFRP